MPLKIVGAGGTSAMLNPFTNKNQSKEKKKETAHRIWMWYSAGCSTRSTEEASEAYVALQTVADLGYGRISPTIH